MTVVDVAQQDVTCNKAPLKSFRNDFSVTF